MTTQLYTHPIFLEHDTGPSHPESAERLRLLLARLDEPEFVDLDRRFAPRVENRLLAEVHEIRHIAHIFREIPKSGRVAIDLTDTIVSENSAEAALRAAGAVCAAVDGVTRAEAKNAFCAVRPPGHHAEPARAMGFCLFNNVAVGAAYARKTYGYERIAVVDFDVHHGNGTQSIFERDPGVFFASIHQGLFFPNTGSPDERGVGNIVNVALARGQGSSHFRRGLEEKIFPALRQFAPEFILVSAGFDAHIADPIGGLRCDNSDFVWVTEEILAIAQACCAGRVVSVLEGGYNPNALASAAAGHIRALMRA